MPTVDKTIKLAWFHRGCDTEEGNWDVHEKQIKAAQAIKQCTA